MLCLERGATFCGAWRRLQDAQAWSKIEAESHRDNKRFQYQKAGEMGLEPNALAAHLVATAHEAGFDVVGIAPVTPAATFDRYQAWLEKGYHGEMGYLSRPDAVAKRRDPALILPGVQSVISVGANYHTYPLPAELREDRSRGIIASYAWGDDYHCMLMARLSRLTEILAREFGTRVAYTAHLDTGPILERDLAARCGLGFIGKNTNLIQPGFGSWLFLGELLVAVILPQTVSVRSERGNGLARGAWGACGQCTRCLEACPTGALVAPYMLDARRCVSYLTIELKGPIPLELRPLLANRIFGCDICQEVCPWNRRSARETTETACEPRVDSVAPRLLDLLDLDDEGFRRRFQGTAMLRAKRRGLLRNVCVGLGNWGEPTAVPSLVRCLADPEPLIRGHAAWALGRIGTQEATDALGRAQGDETDDWVRDEMRRACLQSWL